VNRETRRKRIVATGFALECRKPSAAARMVISDEVYKAEFPDRFARQQKWDRQKKVHNKLTDEFQNGEPCCEELN